MANVKINSTTFPGTREVWPSALMQVGKSLSGDALRFRRILAVFNSGLSNCSCGDAGALFSGRERGVSLFEFSEEVVASVRAAGKYRTAETYSSALRSFRRYMRGRDVGLKEMDSDMMVAYEAYLRREGVSANTSSFYMRNLRALYNRAVEKELIPPHNPFRHVYTGVDKTTKRAVSLEVIRKIKKMDLSSNRSLDFARDMFLFSFYTRGMSFVDMAYLCKSDLKHGVLVYRRRKTGQQLIVKWESCMQDIVCKYDVGASPYLLPIITRPNHDDRGQYLKASHMVNRHLKTIGRRLKIPIPLTMYVARHAWASIARSKNVPLSVISEGMGHDSESTTRIYLASLDNVAIDRANSLILRAL